MGLFSTEYRTSVSTSVARAIAEGLEPSAIKEGTYAALFGKENVRISDSILKTAGASLGRRAEKMHAYGKNHYTYGLPSLQLVSSANVQSVVQVLLATLHGPGTVLSYYHLGAFNLTHYGWQTLMDKHGYVAETNELKALSLSKGVPVYLKDMVPVVVDATLEEHNNGSLDSWGISPNAGKTPQRDLYGLALYAKASSFEVMTAAVTDSLRVTYAWKGPKETVVNGVTSYLVTVQEGTFTIPVVGNVIDADYCQVRYTTFAQGGTDGFEDTVGVSGYWTYRVGSGEVPEIDAIFTPDFNGLGNFFPFAYFRYDKQSMAAHPTSPGYLTSKKLVKCLGLDYAEVIASVHENPNIGDVEQAMLIMAVPAESKNLLDQRYLFDFFNKVYLESGGFSLGSASSVTSPGAFDILKNMFGSPTGVALTLQDARFKMGLSTQAIFKRKKAGVLGIVGTYRHTFEQENSTAEQLYTVDGFDQTRVYSVVNNIHVYCKQITASVYEEIRVYGLGTTYYVSGNYVTWGGEGSNSFLIPLDKSITENYSVFDRETLYARSMHFVFNSRVVTAVKWYQQDWFADLLFIGSLILMFVYPPAGFATWTTAQLVRYAITQILIRVLLPKVLKAVIKVIGIELAFLVAIVAAVAGGIDILKAGGLDGAPWASKLLSISSNMANAVSTSLQEALQGLQTEAELFKTFADKQFKLLDDINKLDDTSTKLSPFIIMGETPDEFNNRTIYSGNVGQSSIDAVYSYTEIALTLPKLQQTIGMNDYDF